MPLLASYVFLNFLKKERLIPLVVQILVVHDLFRASDKKHAIGHECLIELLINLILGFFRKIDHDIPADDQMTSTRIRILQEIMFLKFNPFLDLI